MGTAMYPPQSASLREIRKALCVKRGIAFEEICNDYLKARFPYLTPRVHPEVDWTVVGPPDAYGFDEHHHLVVCQYGPRKDRWRAKLAEDAGKVVVLASRHNLSISRMLFCTTADPDLPEVYAAQDEITRQHGFPVEVITLSRMADDLENLYPSIAFRRLGVPIRLSHFMTLDSYLDSSNPRFWPKRKDIEEGRLYFPSAYLEKIETRLLNYRRCLLSGASGSGKTALAIAFCMWWRADSEGNRKHPEASAYYLDPSEGQGETIGEDWYREVLDHDHQSEVFVIDNCHLAPLAVNAFCKQWECRQPRNALVLLISAPAVAGSSYEDDPEDYFLGFEEVGALLQVRPEDIYRGVLEAYSDRYHQVDEQHFMPVQLDFAEDERASRLENRCSHNLAAARSMLEAWGDSGGRLSDVTEEAEMDGLACRHLTALKTPALAPLCCLQQYEIPAHDSYVGSLPSHSVAALREENLLANEPSPSYGLCHRLLLHPMVAAQVFMAHARRQHGQNYKIRVEDDISSCLTTYLTVTPDIFLPVIMGLWRSGAIHVQSQLLLNADLQELICSRFDDRPLRDMALYLSALHQIDAERAGELLEAFIGSLTLDQRNDKLQNLAPSQFAYVPRLLIRINPTAAKSILSNLQCDWVAERLGGGNLNSIRQWISRSPTCTAARLGYTLAWRSKLAEALDTDVLALKVKHSHAQHLNWFLQAFTPVAPKQAREFVGKLTSGELVAKIGGQPPIVVMRTLNELRKLDCSPELLSEIGQETFDLPQIMSEVQDYKLQRIYWLLRDLKLYSKDLADRLLDFITPSGLANLFREKEGTLGDFHHLLSCCPYEYARDLAAHFTHGEKVEMLAREPLGKVGNALQYRYGLFRAAYVQFAAQFLEDRMATEGLDEIGKFIVRLLRIPTDGEKLAKEAVDILLGVDITSRIVESDMTLTSGLLHGLHAVSSEYPQQILKSVSTAKAIKTRFLKATLKEKAHFLCCLANVGAENFRDDIRAWLRDSNLTEQVHGADIAALAHFLWTTYEYLGLEAAHHYCQVLDTSVTSEQIAGGNYSDLANLLWNILQLGCTPDPQVLECPVLHNRLRSMWETDPGSSAQIVGVLATASMRGLPDLLPGSIDRITATETIATWLCQHAENHVYPIVLAIRGLLALDKLWAERVVTESIYVLDSDEFQDRLRQARNEVTLPLAQILLEETDTFIHSIKWPE